MGKTLKLIKDPIYGSILLSNLEHKVLKNDLVNRLHQIVQMSSVFFVYPSGKHSRFSHSIGVMYLASKALRFGFANAQDQIIVEFLNHVKDYIYTILKQDVRVEDGEIQRRLGKKLEELSREKEAWKSLERLFIRKYLGKSFAEVYAPPLYIMDDSSLRFSYYIFLQLLRLKGLFHDVGHLPFSHIFEFALDKGKLHEPLGKKIAPLVIREQLMSSCEKSDLDDVIICKLLVSLFEREERGDDDEVLKKAISSIISSDVDVDRIDYVLRDGLSTGFLKDSCDYERIVKTFVLTKVEDRKGRTCYLFCPSIQALNDIKELIYDRFRLYKSVINHHKVKKMDAILETVLRMLIKKVCRERQASNELLCKVLDLEEASGSYLRFIMSQLTDDWLLTRLKEEYFLLSEKSEKSEIEEKLFKLLSEFFTFSSQYKSFWKREKDYLESMINIIKRSKDEFKTRISNLWNVLLDLYAKAKKKKDAEREFEIMKLSFVDPVIPHSENEKGDFSKEEQELLSKLQFLLYKGRTFFGKIASENSSLEYLFIPSSLRSIGIKNFLLTDLNSGELIRFGDSTSLGKQLLMDFGMSISFSFTT